MIIRARRTSVFRAGQSLPRFLCKYLPKINERSIVVVTSKIVALSEGRVAVCHTERDKAQLIRAESQWQKKTKYVWLTMKDDVVMANAGVDESNGNGACILLPRDSFRSAATIRRFLMRRYRVKRLGVLITDSRLTPLREGIVGVALGYAGFRGVRDYRGTPDIFGRRLLMTRTNVADSLATAAVLVIGEGSEQQPLAVINDAPVVYVNRVRRSEVLIDPREDIYRPFFDALRKQIGKPKKSPG